MKNKLLIFNLIFTLSALCFTCAFSQNNPNLIVLVKYKTQPGKDSLALSSLNSLVDKVKKEPNYVNITIHVDPVDKSNILLYEQWASEEYYKGEHMKTAHLQQFMTDSRLFLGGPPEITYWKIED
ncbi:MAG: antibiotic biosynthesis monooxygenase [Bacteroidetes bacterium]|nr:antibiotic biosynthesis monooxygenase [Bacteroidota bacterium]